MPRYRIEEQSFIADRLCQPGEEIEFDGLPGANLHPLDAAARKAIKAAEALAIAQDADAEPEGEEAAPVNFD